jgi:hypothetical protein
MEKLSYGVNLKIINKGSTSRTFKAPHIFVKYVINFREYNVYEREKYLAGILGKFDWSVKLLYSDDKDKYFIYKNVGVPVNKDNKPKDGF